MMKVPLVKVLGLTIVLFLGILVYAWVEAKQANPVLLDETGAVRR